MAKIPAIFRDTELTFAAHVSPRVRSRKLAAFALEKISEAKQINAGPGGQPAPHLQIVDGREGAPLASVKPDGIIVAKFSLVAEILRWIDAELVKVSPVREGDYRKSHVLFADGNELNLGTGVPRAREFVFLNTQPYARKIERGSSKQAPQGVYEAVAVVADKRFGNIAGVYYGFREPLSSVMENRAARKRGSRKTASQAARDKRQPAIIVVPR
ncbi:hypothetical protein [Antarcticirhabdus aurantiaca]|uniref:Uncharacterized protein n=1 Tax=Antarcticirhabdus aurantiaca TaxID=2606717 RepID=A0ACD4NR05_9HYPH|nr:hypothetical protein OXU80_03565 [Jeongeuplla avenae]